MLIANPTASMWADWRGGNGVTKGANWIAGQCRQLALRARPTLLFRHQLGAQYTYSIMN